MNGVSVKRSGIKLFAAALSLGLIVTGTLVSGTATFASGGSGGSGGSTKATEYRMTGYVTEIDRANSTVTIGNSYYNIGVLHVNSATNISVDNVNGDFSGVEVGEWVEARYIFSGQDKIATKLVCVHL